MTGPQPKAARERTFTGRHMLIVVVSFFGVVIAVNLTMAVLASQTWTGLVVKNSYVASQHYNEVLAEARQQDSLGWNGALAYDGERLVFALRDRDGLPVHVLDARVRVSRPTHERDDQAVDLTPTSSGYEAEAALAAGIWNADVTARRNDGLTYRAHFRLAVRAGG
jgi:nitrogen fixation protein FixH